MPPSFTPLISEFSNKYYELLLVRAFDTEKYESREREYSFLPNCYLSGTYNANPSQNFGLENSLTEKTNL